MSAQMLLDCKDLYVGYGASQVLFGVNLQIQVGEVVGLLGRNGMGKSTTINREAAKPGTESQEPGPKWAVMIL